MIASEIVLDEVVEVEKAISHLKHLKNELIRNFAFMPTATSSCRAQWM